jgi:hypothetical protein
MNSAGPTPVKERYILPGRRVMTLYPLFAFPVDLVAINGVMYKIPKTRTVIRICEISSAHDPNPIAEYIYDEQKLN